MYVYILANENLKIPSGLTCCVVYAIFSQSNAETDHRTIIERTLLFENGSTIIETYMYNDHIILEYRKDLNHLLFISPVCIVRVINCDVNSVMYDRHCYQHVKNDRETWIYVKYDIKWIFIWILKTDKPVICQNLCNCWLTTYLRYTSINV